MKSTIRRAALASAITLAFAGPAHAVLERVGPISPLPSVGNYPAWYQDKTGITLEFCDPKNQAELDGGWCLLLPGDVTSVPESLQTGNFFDEHFYFAADAGVTTRNGGKGLLVLATEGAFAADVADGGQIVFTRIRVKLTNVPVSGKYRFIHPYGEQTLDGTAGGVIFYTDDVGINCLPGHFECALEGRLGPFLLPSDVPGGAERPPVSGPVPGKLYIADPAQPTAVTGSPEAPFIPFNDPANAPQNHNVFRIEGPAGSGLGVDENGNVVDYIETTSFTLMGRLMSGSIPGRVDVKRAEYQRDGNGIQLDVFAEASMTMPARLPGQNPPAAVAPQLSAYPAPCVGTEAPDGTIRAPYTAPTGVAAKQMMASGAKQWAQFTPETLPTGVCVKDNSARDAQGQIVPTYTPHHVADTVIVTNAFFDPTNKTLSVTASSSDEIARPALTLSFNELLSDMPQGQVAVSNLAAPPSTVAVLSSAGGRGEMPVRVGRAPVVVPVGPVANNDTFTINEDAGPQTFDLLNNDQNAGGATVAITAQPQLGTLTINADGTVVYTPRPDVNGIDAFTYVATNNGLPSNPGNVTINITPVNDKPIAVNETANALTGVTADIDVAANDIDADGNADIVGVDLLTQPVGNAGQTGATVVTVGRVMKFTATQEGTYTFTYKPRDNALSVSDNVGTVTVNVIAAEAVNINRAEYTSKVKRLRADGNISPAANQKITITITDDGGTQIGTVVQVVPSDAQGLWTMDLLGYTLPPGTPTNARIKATSENGMSQSRAIRFK